MTLRPDLSREQRPRYLFAEWKGVVRRLRAAKRFLLIMDFDGTLVPLRARPEIPRTDDSVRRVLARLTQDHRATLYVISGRRRDDVRRRVGVRKIRYLGLHGWEGSEEVSSNGASAKLLRQVNKQLSRRLAGLPAVWIEDKEHVLSVHFRGSNPATTRRAHRIVKELIKPLEGELRVVAGKKVWEVMPREIEGKGEAVRAILARCPEKTLPICLGDDATDEAAFQALRRGMTIRVGEHRRTRARYYLRNPAEVKEFLERLEIEIP
ncbi:MAG: trehalose-phosphatase [Acidobacteriia bacterium]|nr:trehalose-phosphatase [Terriglobia bacterium]